MVYPNTKFHKPIFNCLLITVIKPNLKLAMHILGDNHDVSYCTQNQRRNIHIFSKNIISHITCKHCIK